MLSDLHYLLHYFCYSVVHVSVHVVHVFVVLVLNGTICCYHAYMYNVLAIPQEEDLYQEAEPLVTGGIAAALQLASKKGFISGEKPKRESGESIRTTTDARRDL